MMADRPPPKSANRVSMPDVWDRFDKNETRFGRIEDKIKTLVQCQSDALAQSKTNSGVLKDISESLSVLPAMQEDISSTKEIVEAWGAVKVAGKFLKWISGIVMAVAVIFLAGKTTLIGWIGWSK